ncbi:hypothetical protein IAU60_000974 [Kwoniella sp. DSM 27419]
MLSDTSTPSTIQSPPPNPRTPSPPSASQASGSSMPGVGAGVSGGQRESQDVIMSELDRGTDEHREMDEMMEISREASPASPFQTDTASPSNEASSPRSGQGSGSTFGSGMGAAEEEADVERFLKRMDMEKKMHALQQRLELASVKATKGWKDMSIKEIESKLPPTPSRRRGSRGSHGLLPASPIIASPIRGTPSSPSPSLPYEPPSPSRPWQLIDVLWQPLPPPSHGRYPVSPSSPRKRGREDPETLRAHVSGLGSMPPLSPRGVRQTSGHRRASSSISAQVHERERLLKMGGPSSPLRFGLEGKKKRSTSHSTPRSKAITTSQDVDAAKALTFMLGSGGLSEDDEGASRSRRDSQLSQMSAPLLPALGSRSLPIPEAFTRSGSTSPTLQPRKLGRAGSMSTPRPADLRTPSSHARAYVAPDTSSTASEADRREEDKDAAELMMFLAHSPSPMKRFEGRAPGSEPSSPTAAYRPSLGAAARVLFADDEKPSASAKSVTPGTSVPGADHAKGPANGTVFAPSNLALAPPITPDSSSGPGISPAKRPQALDGVYSAA